MISVPSILGPRPTWETGFARNAMQSANPGLWEGLVGAWYPSLGATGLTLFDVSGRGNHGTLTNMDGTDWVQSPLGCGLDFDGINEVVIAAGPQNLITGSAGATLVVMASHPAGKHTAAGCSTSAVGRFFVMHYTNNQVYFVADSLALGASYRYSGVITSGWHQYALVFNGQMAAANRITPFVDGKIVATTSVGTPPTAIDIAARLGDFKIGVWEFNGVYQTGSTITTLLWNRALTSAEIQHLARDPFAPLRKQAEWSMPSPEGHPTAKRFGGVPFAALNRGVW